MTISEIRAAAFVPHRSASPVHHYRCMATSSEFSSKPLALVTALSLIALLIASTGALSPSSSLGNPESGVRTEPAAAELLKTSAISSPLGEAISLGYMGTDEDPAAKLAGIDPILARRFLSSHLHRLDRYDTRGRSDQRLVIEGLKLFSDKDYLLAGVHFKRATRSNPQNVTARLGLALSLSKLGYQERAFDQLLAALKISPSDPVTLYYGAEVLRGYGRKDKSKALLKRALRSAPEAREWLKADLEHQSSPETLITASIAR